MAERIVKLTTPTMAIQSDKEHLRVVTLPAEAMVAIVDGDINGTGFVKIRYKDQTLAIYAKDLRSRSEDHLNDSTPLGDSDRWRSAFRADVDHDSEVMPISVPN
jgi:hypothetical protein